MKKSLSILAAAVIFGFVGCGGGGSSSSSTSSASATSTGTFVDAPVEGLSYETSSGIKGVTDNQGHFKYKEGDTVTFKIGKALIGKVVPESIVTPYTFGSDKVIYIAYVLQNLDSDGNLSNGIQLPSSDILNQVINESDIELLKNNLDSIKIALKNKGNYKFPDISENEALNNLNNYLATQTDDPLLKEVLTSGLLALKNKNLYFSYVEDLKVYGPGNVSYSDNSIHYQMGEESDDVQVLEWNKTSIKTDEGVIDLFKIDLKYNVLLINDNAGIYVISDKKENVENYKKSFNSLYSSEAVDPKTIKEYLFGVDDDAYKWYAIKLNDTNLSIYKEYDIFSDDLTSGDNLVYDTSKDVKYPGGNKISIYDDGEWKTYDVYKFSLVNKKISVMVLGSMFDSVGPITNIFNKFNINAITFVKGNAYCSLLWNECWIDENALREIDSTFNNINYVYANIKGEPKAPEYSKISDYLKNQEYYSVYTEDTFIDYEKNWYDPDKGFCYQELQSNGDELDSGCVRDIDKYAKILKEYNNGILVEFKHDGIHYKTFLYNNEDDAKSVYERLLPKYQ